ncbi:MAG TPA: 4-alpha-glucanotransferase [Vicinamibacterales bacterium]|nr:4-alpha-glucanotransferase [Vicinamibacterales bacterium]
MNDRAGRRQSGLLIPLFSCPSSTSWGTGDIGDLVPLTGWLAGAGQKILQLLPINERAPGQQSPYSAISAMAIDPMYIRVPDVPEFEALGGEASLTAPDRELLDTVRRAARVDHAGVGHLKRVALRAAFERFSANELCHDTGRARELTAFISEQAWWIEDYALFRAIHASQDERPWTEWPSALQRREPADIDRARRELMREVLFYQYMQWQASIQWSAARAQARGVALFGDLPFMVDGDSADVWARQYQFRLDVSIGAPPDAFTAKGQNWGMPLYRWDVIAAEHFRWMHERVRRSADLYDGYRVDHLVGFFRTFAWPKDGSEPFFTPADEQTQIVLGERLLSIFREAGSTIIAEDLGTVPDFVRVSLARLNVPGFRVLRWERRWHAQGQPFRDPTEYPAISVATSGTHDTESMAVWWGHALPEEREQIATLPTVRQIAGDTDLLTAPFNPTVRDVLLETLFASESNLLLLPMIDAFGWTDRINEPATISSDNWTFRLPWPTDRMGEIPAACERQEALGRWAAAHGR